MSFTDKKKIIIDLGLSRLIYSDSTIDELNFLISNSFKLQPNEIPILPDLHWMDNNYSSNIDLLKMQLYTIIVEFTEPVISLFYLYESKIKALISQSFDDEYLNHTKLNENYKQFMTMTLFLRKFPSL